ncbi:pilus assembly protein TadG-related protein [Paraburkholderia sp. EG285A]|uniref:pilus assembly protein TadG-related protein n=1 Tax=Paraburkholderia sp. EG285A TaxID=3237009 RepID=UPI0034D2E2E3
MIRYPARGRAKRGQRGMVAMQVAVSLVVLLGVGALAIDVARWVIVRNELQNAADAAALAGASQLPGPLVASATQATWSSAAAAATSAANKYAGANSANGHAVATPQTVAVGYWDVNPANQPSTVPSSLSQSNTPTGTEKPAVMVTVGLNPANGTGLPLLLAPILGVSSLHASATAVAIISVPGTAQPGSLFPMAISKCLWTSQGVASTAEFSVGYGASPTSTCPNTAGQWTTFTTTNNSATGAGTLIDSGNPVSLSLGQNTYMQPGAESSVYGSQYPSNAIPPLTVLLPVVADSAVDTVGNTPVLGFATFQIDYVVASNGKCVTGVKNNGNVSLTNCSPPPNLCVHGNGGDCIIGHLVPAKAGSTSAGGTVSSGYFGAVTPPTLAGVPTSEWY